MYTISAEKRVLRLRSDEMWRIGGNKSRRKRENGREIGDVWG